MSGLKVAKVAPWYPYYLAVARLEGHLTSAEFRQQVRLWFACREAGER